jgi:hypothetical protein
LLNKSGRGCSIALNKRLLSPILAAAGGWCVDVVTLGESVSEDGVRRGEGVTKDGVCCGESVAKLGGRAAEGGGVAREHVANADVEVADFGVNSGQTESGHIEELIKRIEGQIQSMVAKLSAWLQLLQICG